MRKLLVPLVFLLSCGSSQPEPAAPTTDPTPQIQAPTWTARPDDGPILKHMSGNIAHIKGETKQAAAARTFSDHQHAFVSLILPTYVFARDMTVVDRYAFVASDDSVNKEGKEVFIRFVGELPKTFTLRAWDSVKRDGQLATRQFDVTVTTSGATSDNKLPNQFREAAASVFTEYLGAPNPDPFFVFAANRLRMLAGQSSMFSGPRQSDTQELMDLYTGMTSVREALQFDRGFLVRDDVTRRDQPLKDIAGVPLPEHPWDTMIKELGAKTAIEPMAESIPHDMLYVHMHDLRDFVTIAHELDTWLTPLAQILEQNNGPSHFAKRYEQQLVVGRTGLSETLGHLATDGVALTFGDPFLREGTDVSIVFRVRNRTLLTSALDGFEQALRSTRQDVAVTEVEILGTKVRLLSTPDNVARQYRVALGDLLVLSNSPAAIAKFIAVSRGKEKSLKDTKDLSYMRTLFPFSRETESGFVFISDAFVAHAISPRVKIVQARRMQAQADLFSVNYAALLFGYMEGRQPKNVAELINAGFLHKEELFHSDKTPISFSPERGAWSEVGTVAWIRPNAEWKIDKVTAREQQAYERFRNTYQSYWRQFIDPIAVRLKRDGKRLRAEVRMLPLIESSGYNKLLRLVGQARIQPPDFATGAVWAFGVGQEASLRQQLNEAAQMVVGNSKINVGWLGDWVMVGAAERSGLWDAALAAGAIPEVEYRETKWEANSVFTKVLQRLPIFAAAQIGNQLVLAAALTALRTYIDQAAPNLLDWRPGEPFRDIPVVTIKEKNPGSSAAFGIQLHYAIVEDVLLVAVDRATLELQITYILDGAQPKSVQNVSPTPSPQDLQSSIAMRLGNEPELTWMGKTLLGLFEKHASLNRGGPSAAYKALRLGLARDLDAADLQRMGLAYLGYEPRTVHGGVFSLNKLGVVDHSIYGGIAEQRFLSIPVAGSPVTAAIVNLSFVELALGFSGQGQHRGLYTRLTWDQKVSK